MHTVTRLPDILPLIGLEGIVLRSGGHGSREDGVCALEAVAWLAGRSAARSALAPTVAALQVSASGLVTRMVALQGVQA